MAEKNRGNVAATSFNDWLTITPVSYIYMVVFSRIPPENDPYTLPVPLPKTKQRGMAADIERGIAQLSVCVEYDRHFDVVDDMLPMSC